MRLIFRACVLAWRDYAHEGLLSACAVLSLAAVLAPLLVLYGVKFGVLTTMTDRLKNDPRNLEISPVASGRYTPDFLAELARRPDVAFVLPRTRAISATMELAVGEGSQRRVLNVSLEPSAPGDPLLARHLDASTTALSWGRPPSGLVLSASAARKLGLKPGDAVNGRVERAFRGAAQSARASLIVAAVLPLEAEQKDVAFIPLPLLEATEDYRDGRAAPALGWPGEPRPDSPRLYPSFRLYARTLHDVAVLRRFFSQRRVEVYTRAEEIAAVTDLDRSLTLIFSLISAAAGLGFLASTASNALAGVRRKEKHLGLIRLTGYPTRAIMAFPLFQSLTTGLLGTLLASGLYLGAALIIDHLFASGLQGVEQVCRLLPRHFATALGLVLLLSLLGALQPGARAARIEPSEVIRDV